MVRKVIRISLFAAILLSVIITPAAAATHNVYTEGNISTTYVQYFKDIISGTNINDDYVGFRSGQYTYCLVVGDLRYESGSISLESEGTIYTFNQTGTYNSTHTYTVSPISNFSLNSGNAIIYSNVGNYPHLVERSTHVETVILITLCSMCLFGVVTRIFRHS